MWFPLSIICLPTLVFARGDWESFYGAAEEMRPLAYTDPTAATSAAVSSSSATCQTTPLIPSSDASTLDCVFVPAGLTVRLCLGLSVRWVRLCDLWSLKRLRYQRARMAPHGKWGNSEFINIQWMMINGSAWISQSLSNVSTHLMYAAIKRYVRTSVKAFPYSLAAS